VLKIKDLEFVEIRIFFPDDVKKKLRKTLGELSMKEFENIKIDHQLVSKSDGDVVVGFSSKKNRTMIGVTTHFIKIAIGDIDILPDEDDGSFKISSKFLSELQSKLVLILGIMTTNLDLTKKNLSVNLECKFSIPKKLGLIHKQVKRNYITKLDKNGAKTSITGIRMKQHIDGIKNVVHITEFKKELLVASDISLKTTIEEIDITKMIKKSLKHNNLIVTSLKEK
jgi:hypothetical protein